MGFPSLSALAEMRRTRRSGCFPLEMADRRSGGSSSGGGIKRGGGLGADLRFGPPTVIATGCGGERSGTDEDGPATCEADACIDATSCRCLSLFAAKGQDIVRTARQRVNRLGKYEPSRSLKSASRWKLCMSAEYRLTCHPI